jgi:hypothetical protein
VKPGKESLPGSIFDRLSFDRIKKGAEDDEHLLMLRNI